MNVNETTIPTGQQPRTNSYHTLTRSSPLATEWRVVCWLPAKRAYREGHPDKLWLAGWRYGEPATAQDYRECDYGT